MTSSSSKASSWPLVPLVVNTIECSFPSLLTHRCEKRSPINKRFMQFRFSYLISGSCPEIYLVVEFITFNLVLVRFGFQIIFSFWNFNFQFDGIVHVFIHDDCFHFQMFPFMMIRDDDVGLNRMAPTREMVRGREPCRTMVSDNRC